PILAFWRGEGGRVIAHKIENGQNLEERRRRFAEIDIQIVTNGMQHLVKRVKIVAGYDVFSGLQRRGDFTPPPGLDDLFELAVRAQEKPRMFCINSETFLLGLCCCGEHRW